MEAEIKEALERVEFQLDNVKGWLSRGKYDAAEIKAECLFKAAIDLHELLCKHRSNTGQ